MRNAALYGAIKRYCQDALPAIASRLGPLRALTSAAGDQWFVSLYKLEDELKRLDSYIVADRALHTDAVVASQIDTLVGTAQGGTRVDADGVLRRILVSILKDQDRVVFNDQAFKRVYVEFEDFFHKGTIALRAVAPLQRFRMQADRLELETGPNLIRFSKEEVDSMKQEIERFAGLAGAVPPTGIEEFGFEVHLEVPKVIGIDHPADAPLESELVNEAFGEALSALRIFKPGLVGYGFARITPVGWSPIGGAHWNWGHEAESRPGPQYTLVASEIPAFLAFWAEFQTARERRRPRVTLALRRFNFAYGRLRPEDRLIDHAIALEALLLKREETQELKYRLALRGAYLLEQVSNRRATTHALLSKAYDERSNIVHGGAVPTQVSFADETVPFHVFVDKVADVLRDAIGVFLRRTDNETAIIAGLDDLIVRGNPAESDF